MQVRKVNQLKCLTLDCEVLCSLFGTSNFIKEARYCTACSVNRVMVVKVNDEVTHYTEKGYQKFIDSFKISTIPQLALEGFY